MNALKMKSKSEFNPSAAFSHLGVKNADNAPPKSRVYLKRHSLFSELSQVFI